MEEHEMESGGMTFYRCTLCHGVVSLWDIEALHACPKCGGTRISPSNLTWLEKLAQLWKHPGMLIGRGPVQC